MLALLVVEASVIRGSCNDTSDVVNIQVGGTTVVMVVVVKLVCW